MASPWSRPETAGQAVSLYPGLPVPRCARPLPRRRVHRGHRPGRLVVLAATGNPFFTTDTTAALRAAELGCDAILKATQLESRTALQDPKTNPRAERYDRLTFSEVLARDLKVMDAAAIALARDNAIPIVVFSLHQTAAIAKVMSGEVRYSVAGSDSAASINEPNETQPQVKEDGNGSQQLQYPRN